MIQQYIDKTIDFEEYKKLYLKTDGKPKKFASERDYLVAEQEIVYAVNQYNINKNIFDDVDDYFANLKVDVGTPDNPLLMITNNAVSKIPDNGLTSDNHSEFLVLSDLHLDMGCWRKDGTLDVAKFNENLNMFESFKSVCMEKFPHVKGIIVAGDIFDAFTNISSNVLRVDTKVRDDLVASLQNFYANRKKNNIKGGEMPSFVVGVLGNHDFSMGNHFYDCYLRLNKVMANLFGSDAKIIGASSVRINMGNDFIAIMHPDAYDYHIENDYMRFRNSRNTFTKAPIRLRTYNNMTLF